LAHKTGTSLKVALYEEQVRAAPMPIAHCGRFCRASIASRGAGAARAEQRLIRREGLPGKRRSRRLSNPVPDAKSDDFALSRAF